MYKPDIPHHNGCTQLNQSILWFAIGENTFVIFVCTNCDGTNTSTKTKSYFFYLRLGNVMAPWCFQAGDTHHTLFHTHNH